MNVSALVLMVVLAVAAVLAWRRRLRSYALGFALFALLPGWTFASSLTWPFALLAAAGGVLLGWQRWSSSQGRMGRWSARSRRRAGMASSWDIARRAGGPTLRRLATKVRPTLADASPVYRWWLMPLAEVGVELAAVGMQRVWSPIEDVVLIFGGPRKGKSGWLAGRVCDAAGAVLVASTRTDLLRLCRRVREETRGPVRVFNAAGYGDIDTDFCFDPLTGCEDPVIAMERAEDMVTANTSGNSGGDRGYWQGQASRVLAAFLHAAALGRGSMHDVLGWTASSARAGKEVPALLQRSSVAAFASDVEQFVTTNDRTRTSITNSMMPALAWLSHPAAVAAAAPGASVDVAELLISRTTVFLVGKEEAKTAALVCALIGHVTRTAHRLAEDPTSPVSRDGRLDAPLTLALDEAALISPVPLERWTSDMGGRGIVIIAAFQSRAQLLARYGEHDAAAILNNAGATMLFGGTADRDDLQWWSTRAGERDEVTVTTDAAGKVTARSVRRVPVFSMSQIANLRPGQVIVFRNGIDPALGWAPMAWRRRDVLAATADLPAAAGAPGLAGWLRFSAHRPAVRALFVLDDAIGLALGHGVGRAGRTVSTAAARAGAAMLALLRVALERARFTARRARRVPTPRDQAAGAAPSAPHALPLKVVSYREPAMLAVDPRDPVGPQGALDEVDPPTGPIDLRGTRAHEHVQNADETADKADPPTGPIDLSQLREQDRRRSA